MDVRQAVGGPSTWSLRAELVSTVVNNDLPSDYEAACSAGLWGLWWTSVAAAAGVLPATLDPLPENDEVEALYQATVIAFIDPRAADILRRTIEGRMDQAVEAFRKALLLLREVQDAKPASEWLCQKMAHAVIEAERVGRFAAYSVRVHMLLLHGLEAAS